MRYLFVRVLIGLCFILVVLSVHSQLPRFVVTGPQLLVNNNFSDQLTGWQLSGDLPGSVSFSGSEISLLNNQPEESLSFRQQVAWTDRTPFMQLSADLRSTNIIPGSRSWHLGRLVLVRYTREGQWLNLPHYVASLTGTSNWQHYSETFSYNSRAESVQILLQMPYATGALQARNLSLRAAEPNTLYPNGQVLVFCLAGGFLFYLLRPYLWRRGEIGLRIGLVLTCSAILVGTLMPAQLKGEVGVRVGVAISEIETAISSAAETSQVLHAVDTLMPRDKVLHFGGFLLLGFFLSGLQCKSSYVMLNVILFACTTELLQLFIEGRTPLVSDVLIDVCGGILGLLCLSFLTGFLSKAQACSSGANKA